MVDEWGMGWLVAMGACFLEWLHAAFVFNEITKVKREKRSGITNLGFFLGFNHDLALSVLHDVREGFESARLDRKKSERLAHGLMEKMMGFMILVRLIKVGVRRDYLHMEAEAALSMFALLSVKDATISTSNGRGLSSLTRMSAVMRI